MTLPNNIQVGGRYKFSDMLVKKKNKTNKKTYKKKKKNYKKTNKKKKKTNKKKKKLIRKTKYGGSSKLQTINMSPEGLTDTIPIEQNPPIPFEPNEVANITSTFCNSSDNMMVDLDFIYVTDTKWAPKLEMNTLPLNTWPTNTPVPGRQSKGVDLVYMEPFTHTEITLNVIKYITSGSFGSVFEYSSVTPLPPGWIENSEIYNGQYVVIYYNTLTGESILNRPRIPGDKYYSIAVKKFNNLQDPEISLISGLPTMFCNIINARIIDSPLVPKIAIMDMMEGNLNMLKGYINFEQIGDIIKILLKSIKCFQQNGYMYTDMKLDNILYKCQYNGGDRNIKIVFGDIGSLCSGLRGRAGDAGQSYSYIPPEVSLGIRFVCDSIPAIWGIGIILYDLLDIYRPSGGIDPIFINPPDPLLYINRSIGTSNSSDGPYYPITDMSSGMSTTEFTGYNQGFFYSGKYYGDIKTKLNTMKARWEENTHIPMDPDLFEVLTQMLNPSWDQRFALI